MTKTAQRDSLLRLQIAVEKDEPMKTITPFELQRLIDKGAVELIDVRPRKDFEKVHALTARSIPLSGFEPHSVLASRRLDKHAPLYLICRRKTLASLAACGLAGAGLEEAIVVEGGLEAWEGQCLPVARRVNLWRMPRLDAPTIMLLLGIAVVLGLAFHGFFFLIALPLFAVLIVRRTLGPGTSALIQGPQEMRRIEFGRCFASVRSVVAVALIVGFLAFFGGTVLQAGPAVATSKPAAQLSKPEKAARASTEIERGAPGKSEIALTFDAGANAECFEDLIAALERARVRSTFFITGNWAQRNMDCARAITKHGHEVGNHTWNHLDLTKQSDEIVREEITRAEDLLTEISWQTPRPRWRAPFGARDQRVLRIATSLGYRSIYWTIDSLDSMEPRKTREFLIDRVTSMTDAQLDGAIILMHVGIQSTADALPAIIANLQNRGFRLVTVSKLLEAGPKRP
jgi:peptidoglycan/xylan/chitin deacetylase (PgdA/CDA1 family)/rhodanese-related sulfurtransferase